VTLQLSAFEPRTPRPRTPAIASGGRGPRSGVFAIPAFAFGALVLIGAGPILGVMFLVVVPVAVCELLTMRHEVSQPAQGDGASLTKEALERVDAKRVAFRRSSASADAASATSASGSLEWLLWEVTRLPIT
jgi:hypothetical protein